RRDAAHRHFLRGWRRGCRLGRPGGAPAPRERRALPELRPRQGRRDYRAAERVRHRALRPGRVETPRGDPADGGRLRAGRPRLDERHHGERAHGLRAAAVRGRPHHHRTDGPRVPEELMGLVAASVSPFIIAVLKYAFIALVYFFVFRAIRSVAVELSDRRAAKR